MVVMARATGLPARLAVGYASGAYDAINARYVVTEADAHSWVEIYFPNYGWVEFEPTSNRSELGSVSNNNPTNAAVYPPWLYQPTLTAKTQISAQLRQQASIILVLIIVVVLLALLLFFISQRRYARLAPIKVMQAIYQDLYRHGTSLQVPVAPGSTPLELSLSFSERLEQINKNGFWKTNQVNLKREVDSLISLYNRAIFSPHPIHQADILLARQSMRQVQRHVWIAWINSFMRPL
jgi:hypothetical protein